MPHEKARRIGSTIEKAIFILKFRVILNSNACNKLLLPAKKTATSRKVVKKISNILSGMMFKKFCHTKTW